METLFNEKAVSSDRYLKIRKVSEKICQPLYAEDYVVQPITDVSPPKWHLGHTSWFFEAFILRNYYVNYKIFNPSYNFIFNSYYESIGDRLLRSNRGNLTRPGYQEILEYRSYVNNHMKELLENTDNSQVLYLTELGLNHEQQHQELLITDIKYILGHNPLFPGYIDKQDTNINQEEFTPEEFIEIPEDICEIGYGGDNFCYDNETPKHKAYVNKFRIMNRLITNQEYLEFINDGGYKNFIHWHMEGWETVKKENWECPLYWIKDDGRWLEYTLEGLKELSPNAPVTHISFYEAAAYAAWAGKRLLTENEWEAAAQYLKADKKNGNFIESEIYHPTTVNSDNPLQLFGDCWEWTYSAYHPYPGYKREEGALGEYNAKFMVNQLVLKGGSCATSKSHIRSTYRNFFHADKRWQFTGIRLAEDI